MVLPTEPPVILTGDDASMIAIDGAAALQVPLTVASANVVTEPAHTVCVPVMAAGLARTVKPREEEQEPIE